MSREELKDIARKIIDYRRNDHAKLMSTLNVEELRELPTLIREVEAENIARERAEHEAFIKREEERNREHARFLADTDRFIAKMDKILARRRNNSPTLFPFPLGEA